MIWIRKLSSGLWNNYSIFKPSIEARFFLVGQLDHFAFYQHKKGLSALIQGSATWQRATYRPIAFRRFFENQKNGKNLEQLQLAIIIKMTLRSKDVNANDPLASEGTHNRGDHNIKFYEEYRKIFTTGFYLSQQLRQLVSSKEDLWKKLLSYEKRAQEDFKDKMRKEAPERKKRFRRTANEIEKKYTCDAPRCNRSYGSQGSLLQHIKLKHPEKYDEMSKSGRGKFHSDSINPDSIFE